MFQDHALAKPEQSAERKYSLSRETQGYLLAFQSEGESSIRPNTERGYSNWSWSGQGNCERSEGEYEMMNLSEGRISRQISLERGILSRSKLSSSESQRERSTLRTSKFLLNFPICATEGKM